MSFASLQGGSPTAATPAGTGLSPNQFNLQTTGPNATVMPRPYVGFGPGSQTLAAQVPQTAQPASSPASPVTPPAANPAASGPYGRLIAWLDQMRNSPHALGNMINPGSGARGPTSEELAFKFMNRNNMPGPN